MTKVTLESNVVGSRTLGAEANQRRSVTECSGWIR